MQVQDHFIPVSTARLVAALLEAPGGDGARAGGLERLCRLYIALYVLRMHARLQAVKREYAPFDPDTDAPPPDGSPDALLVELDRLLQQANYRRLRRRDIEIALASVSPHGLQVSVDLDDFSQLRLYCRSDDEVLQHRRHWRSLWLRRIAVSVPVYRRLFLCVIFKSEQQRTAELVAAGSLPRAARRRARRSRVQLPPAADAGHAFLRLFRDIPQSDLETLFPNRRVRMHHWDKIKLGVTGGGGTASGVAATLTKLSVAASPLALAGALGGLALVISRQVAKVLGQRTRYLAVLTRSLYFHCLDNNFGVVARLLDAALEEECKEVLLAYYWLWRSGPCDSATLDRRVEDWMRERFALAVDFDVADGVGKLREDGLLHEDGGRLRVLGLEAALELLEQRWLAYPER